MRYSIPYKYITIEGNIGAGKTTLSRLLSEEMQASLILERFAENPFLELFYSDKKRYGFQVELFFLADRYKQLKEAITNMNLFADTLVSDYFLDKCFIFARNNIEELEYKLYMQLFDIIKMTLPYPDLVIYLNTPTDKLLENIEKRGREFEKNITSDYLNEINSSYLRHFAQIENRKILMLDATHYDFLQDKSLISRLCQQLEKPFQAGITKIQL